MKRLVLLVVLTIFIFSTLAACGKSTADTDNGTIEKGVLIVATSADFKPYEYMESNQIQGIDIEIARVLGEKLGLKVRFIDMKFKSILNAVAQGKADIGIAGISVTDERKKLVDFSKPYTKEVQVIVVRVGSEIKSAEDLFAEGAKHKVGVQTGTTGDIYCSDDIEDAGLGTVERYNAGANAIKALENGKIDCVVIDGEPAKAFVEHHAGLMILESTYADEDYSIAYKKGNNKLEKAVNSALEELKTEGKIKEIVDKYINK